MAEAIEERLLFLLKRFQCALPADEYASVRDLVVHREWGVAFENLCEQLFEHSIVVGPEALKEMEKLATEMNLPDSSWSFLSAPDRQS